MIWRFFFGVLIIASGFTLQAQDRSSVSEGVESRTGHGIRTEASSNQARGLSLPPGITFSGMVTEDEAIAIALWNNAELEATLANLGLARADLIDAGLLRNPSIQALFPIGPKPFEFALQAPMEILWQRPRRVDVAKLNLQQISESLMQNALDLVRDVKIAYSELERAKALASVARESSDLLSRIAELMMRRFKTGDISEMEELLSRMDAKSQSERAGRLSHDVELARNRLRLLMGLQQDKSQLDAVAAPIADTSVPEWETLLEMAMSSRPDLRAAELAIKSAVQKAKWERSRILALIAPILSIKEVGSNGVRTGPGLAAEIPVFNRNQGGISRADAEVVKATRLYQAMRDRVELEVRQSRIQLLQAQESLGRLRQDVIPPAQEAIRLAEKAHSNGDASYLSVLEASRQIFDVRGREADAVAGVRQAKAQLERSVGRKL